MSRVRTRFAPKSDRKDACGKFENSIVCISDRKA